MPWSRWGAPFSRSRWRSPEGPTLLGLSRALTSPPNACGQSNHAGTVTATAPGLEQHLAPPVRSSRNTCQEGAITTPILAGGDGAREQPGPEPQAQALPPPALGAHGHQPSCPSRSADVLRVAISSPPDDFSVTASRVAGGSCVAS